MASVSNSFAATIPIRPQHELLSGEIDEAVEDVEGDGGDGQEIADGEECRQLRPRKAPPCPSAETIAAHRLAGHAVYRSWCRECVQGRGKNSPHYSKAPGGEKTVPVISFDYGYLGAKGKEDNSRCETEGQSPILAYWDSQTRALFAHMVPHKGVDHPEISWC